MLYLQRQLLQRQELDLRGFAIALRAKGETISELTGLAQAMPAEDWLRQTWQQAGALLG